METMLDYSDVLIRPNYSLVNSRKDVELARTFEFKNAGQTKTVVPIVAANMASVGTPKVAEVLSEYNMLTALHKFVDINEVDSNNSIRTVGQTDREIANLYNKVGMHYTGYLMIDVANGHTEKFIRYCEALRRLFPSAVLIAGNIGTRSVITNLESAGVDIIKVGIGPGQHCLTRSVTGVGVPQLSLVQECAYEVWGGDTYIMADGGITEYGDVSKAFVAGADFVMIGSMFAGHDECEGQLRFQNGTWYMECYGMASTKAMETHYGHVPEYRASEGRHTMIPCKGPLKDTVNQLLGGIRSAMTYTSSKTIKELKHAELVKVNRTINRNLEKYEI